MTEKKTRTFEEALLAAFKNINNPTKDSSNPHFKYKYASLEAVLAAIRPALLAEGIVFLQNVVITSDGRAALEAIFIHETRSYPFGPMLIPCISHGDPQKVKSGITYMRRTQILSLFGLAEVDDDGNEAAQKSESKDKDSRPPSNPAEKANPFDFGVAEASIRGCKTSADLKDRWTHWKKLAPDGATKAKLDVIKDETKDKLKQEGMDEL